MKHTKGDLQQMQSLPLEAKIIMTQRRIREWYDYWEGQVYISFSGGKDSSVMIQLAARKARELNKKFSVLYIDLEAQYKATIEHIEELRTEISDVCENFYWCALPLSLRNAVSVIQPKWICWDKKDKHQNASEASKK